MKNIIALKVFQFMQICFLFIKNNFEIFSENLWIIKKSGKILQWFLKKMSPFYVKVELSLLYIEIFKNM